MSCVVEKQVDGRTYSRLPATLTAPLATGIPERPLGSRAAATGGRGVLRDRGGGRVFRVATGWTEQEEREGENFNKRYDNGRLKRGN